MVPSYLIRYCDLVKSGRWPITPCLRGLEPRDVDASTIFISHPWLSRDHPDPDGRKFSILADWWNDLAALRERVRRIDPGSLEPGDWPLWVDRRFRGHPIARKDRFNASPWQKIQPLPNQVASHSPAFIQWLSDSIDEVLEASLWIDTFAIPSKAHRSSCEYCANSFGPTLQSIPEIISLSTCVVMNDLIPDDRDRGWMLFEAGVASAHSAMILANQSSRADWSRKYTLGRIFSLDYSCTEAEDAVVLPRLIAIHQILPSYVENPLLPSDLISQGMAPFRKVLFNTLETSVVGQMRALFAECLSFQYLHFVRGIAIAEGGPFAAGRRILCSLTYAVHGILMSEAYSTRKSRKQGVDTCCYLQACIFFWVCCIRDVLPADYIAHGVLYHWQKATEISLVELDWLEKIGWMKDLLDAEPAIKQRYEDWMSGKIFNIHIDRFHPRI